MAKRSRIPQQRVQQKAQQQKAFLEAVRKHKPFSLPQTDKKIVLTLGYSSAHPNTLHPTFKKEFWHEVRLDVDVRVQPDLVIESLAAISQIADHSIDAVWMPQVLHRLTYHHAEQVIREIVRMVRVGGDILVSVPDLQLAAAHIARAEDEQELYHAPAGVVYPADMMFGFRPFIARGDEARVHKSGYTCEMLGKFLRDLGVSNIYIARSTYELLAHGKYYPYDHPERVERMAMQAPPQPIPTVAQNASPAPQAAQAVRYADPLDTEPQLWKPLGLK